MKNLIKLVFILTFIISCKQEKKETRDYTTLFEKSNGTETETYENVILFYKNLASDYKQISLFEMGKTDSGEPLHLVVFNTNGAITKDQLKTSIKSRVLINNGIHPGESDGIDATMMLYRNLVQNDSLQKLVSLYNSCIQHWRCAKSKLAYTR